jgi:hypothetical protein
MKEFGVALTILALAFVFSFLASCATVAPQAPDTATALCTGELHSELVARSEGAHSEALKQGSINERLSLVILGAGLAYDELLTALCGVPPKNQGAPVP